MINTRSSRSISSHSAWLMASRKVIVGMALFLLVGVDVLVEPFGTGLGAFLGKASGLGDLAQRLRVDAVQFLFGSHIPLEQHLAELPDRVVRLPLHDFLVG